MYKEIFHTFPNKISRSVTYTNIIIVIVNVYIFSLRETAYGLAKQVSISSTFYASVFQQYPFAKKSQSGMFQLLIFSAKILY